MNKNIKLSLLFILILTVVISFFGCGKSTTRNSSKDKKMSDSEIEKNFKMKRIEGGYSIKEYIGESANVYIPRKYKGYTIKKIEEEAFAGMKFLEKVEVASSIEEISSEAFKDCEALKTVTLKEGLKKIGYRAFHNASIETITIPSTVEYVNGFDGCKNLKTVTLKEGLKKIEGEHSVAHQSKQSQFQAQ